MKTEREKKFFMIPLALWFVLIPLIVKVKFFANPLATYSWYSADKTLVDFFLYYKSLAVTIVGILMLVFFVWEIANSKKKAVLFSKESYLFIPLLSHLILTVFSTLFSEYKYFSSHGMPDQFETIWNLISYVIACVYAYYAIRFLDAEHSMIAILFTGAVPISLICVLQYFKIDIYRMIYADKGYAFTFAEGTVYGSFYNINYVGYYTLLFVPIFLVLCLVSKDIKQKVAYGILSVALLLAMIGADSITSEIAIIIVAGFVIVFLLLKHVKEKKFLYFPLATIMMAVIVISILAIPRISTYLQASDTEKKDLEKIITRDDCVELHYKGEILRVAMEQTGDKLLFLLKDSAQNDVTCEYKLRDDYYYYQVSDERFQDISLIPAIMTDEPLTYGFLAEIAGKSWCFSNQIAEDGSYYYRADTGAFTQLTEEHSSADFEPLVSMSGLANGRGFIWNKTITLLKDYVLFGSGADTFALVFPNKDFVDRYNNGYDNKIITKPHNMYLQMAIQSGVLALICFLVFYVWYAISSMQIYFKESLTDPLAAVGFAIFLSTIGYMIAGIANDSTITITPLFWALLGMGIGINHKLCTQNKKVQKLWQGVNKPCT